MIKHTVYFFSGTGNSLAVVKELEKQGATAVSISALADTKVVCNSLKIGFVFPVYYLGLPKIVHDFLNKLEITDAKYIYAVYTMGWNLRGGVTKQLKAHLASKNLKLNMSNCIQMPMNDFTLATVHTKEQQQKILGNFDTEMKQIIDRISNEQNYFSAEPLSFLVKKRNEPFCARCNASDVAFSVLDDCSGCGICVKVCPAKNITLQDKKPSWNHQCQNCMACFHYCPKKAITFTGKGKEITRYHHPAISASELEKYHSKQA